MGSVVQAVCPQCRQTLRIPGDWVGQPMRCKRCRTPFQSRPRATAAPSVPAAAPVSAAAPILAGAVAVAAPAAAANGSHLGNGFDFGGHGTGPAIVPGLSLPARRSHSGWWIGACLLGSVALVAVVVGVFAWPHLAELFGTDDQKQVAAGPKKETNKKVGPTTKKSPDRTGLPTPPLGKKKEPGTEGPKTEVPPPKKEEPKKEEPKKEPPVEPKKEPTPKIPTKKTPVRPPRAGAFPRRALLVNVSNYIYFNPLHYGSPRDAGYPGSSTAALKDQLSRPPFNIPANQIFELSDGAREPFPVVKETIENAIKDFCRASRDQDRILLLFTGHALDIEKEAYLVPVEGKRDDASTLIPLSFVYDQLAKSPARQKILVLDVFRYPPARGEEIPGTGALTEDFEAKVAAPPPGVQVWTSCLKEQQSLEFEYGSLFLQCIMHAVQDRKPAGKGAVGFGIARPDEAIPIEAIVPLVNQRLQEQLAMVVVDGAKAQQQSRLTGKEADAGAPYDPDVPPAPLLAFKEPSLGGDKSAGRAVVASILDEINQLPSAKKSTRGLTVGSMPPFPAGVLKEFKPDAVSLAEIEKKVNDAPEATPIRYAYFVARDALREAQKVSMKEYFPNPGGNVSDKVKALIADEQKPIGLLDFKLKNALAELEKAEEMREKETSKRWLAHFDLAHAKVKASLFYLNEYQTVLARIRSDALPELKPGDSGWRIGSTSKMASSDAYFRDLNKEVKRGWKRLAKEYADTPWGVIAAREGLMNLGLQWRASRE